LNEARNLIEVIVDYIELIFLQQPFLTVIGYMCEEARDPVLAESINQTSVAGLMETLIKALWLSDINTELERKELLRAIKALPEVQLLRSTIAGHLITRSYWRHWRREDRLSLLDAAHESLKGAGLNYNKTELKRMIEGSPGTDKFEV
jgi:hypothetical protein